MQYLYGMYLVKTPWWLRILYPTLTWRMPGWEKRIYLSFDDGPHATATPFVLDLLRQYNAKASFFCIGKNVASHPDVYNQVLQEGHSVGNHTHDHLNGWKTGDAAYLSNVQQAAAYIESPLFRPPYGRIRRSQLKQLQASGLKLRTIMWDVLSGDFDTTLDGKACLAYVLYHARPGSIVLFHDSAKAWDRMRVALPGVLAHFSKEGYRFEAIPMEMS